MGLAYRYLRRLVSLGLGAALIAEGVTGLMPDSHFYYGAVILLGAALWAAECPLPAGIRARWPRAQSWLATLVFGAFLGWSLAWGTNVLTAPIATTDSWRSTPQGQAKLAKDLMAAQGMSIARVSIGYALGDPNAELVAHALLAAFKEAGHAEASIRGESIAPAPKGIRVGGRHDSPYLLVVAALKSAGLPAYPQERPSEDPYFLEIFVGDLSPQP